MIETLVKKEVTRIDDYSHLKRAIQETLVRGQQQIESLKVQIYWQTGRTIKMYLGKHPDISGPAVLDRLAEDFGLERSLFYRILQFAESFPKVVPGRLSWTHYRALLALPDGRMRKELAQEAEAGRWPVMRLRREIFKRKDSRKSLTNAGTSLEEPRKGNAGVYKIGRLAGIDGKKRKVVDLGFENYRELSTTEASRFEMGQTVMWSKENWVAGGTKDDLYFYEAEIERVVDADTIRIHVDLGFGLTTRQYLRLRGINAEELSTPQGQKAREFLLGLIGKETIVQFKSRSRDPFDRYISDIWIGEHYINQILIDEGYAKLV